jgi:aminomethyltransferase
LCCDDATGGVVDDLIVYVGSIGAEHGDDLHLVPNAANSAEVVRRLAAVAPAGVDVRNQHEEFAILAVQGPHSPDVLRAVGLDPALDYMSFALVGTEGDRVVVCRTGYTGEHGYELVIPAERALGWWDRLLPAVEANGGRPCGLGARDTLRTEMGYPLHGQDLSLDITPVQARCGWAVGWSKPAFWGRDVLSRERAEGARRSLWGVRADGRAIPRPHMTVRDADGGDVGEVTSGTFSPTLRTGIGLALLDRAVKEGDEVVVDVRGQAAPMQVTKPPFVESHVRA